jgi:RsmE family RNA methyltransferase
MFNASAHLFALYFPPLTSLLQTNRAAITIDDSDFIHRITHILRLRQHEPLIIFDAQQYIRATITTISKSQISLAIVQYSVHKIISPKITVLLPMLKKEAMEKALYSLTVLGTTHIQLYTSSKTHRESISASAIERFNRIMIAAAEQSKQFVLPSLAQPISFEKIVDLSLPQPFYFADPQGISCTEIITSLVNTKPSSVTVMVGPEGDLIPEEKEVLRAHATFCKLTPTILKAEDALFLLTGIIRSVM